MTLKINNAVLRRDVHVEVTDVDGDRFLSPGDKVGPYDNEYGNETIGVNAGDLLDAASFKRFLAGIPSEPGMDVGVDVIEGVSFSGDGSASPRNVFVTLYPEFRPVVDVVDMETGERAASPIGNPEFFADQAAQNINACPVERLPGAQAAQKSASAILRGLNEYMQDNDVASWKGEQLAKELRDNGQVDRETLRSYFFFAYRAEERLQAVLDASLAYCTKPEEAPKPKPESWGPWR